MAAWKNLASILREVLSKKDSGPPETRTGRHPDFDPKCEAWRHMAELLYVRVDGRVIVGEIFSEGKASESVVFWPKRTGQRLEDIPQDRVIRCIRWLLKAPTIPVEFRS